MNEVLELKAPIIVIDHDLDNSIDHFPEKTRRAKAMLTKHGLPKEWQADYDKIIREKSFWVFGILNQADAETKTFCLVGKAAGSPLEMQYVITTSDAETLSTLVKNYWNTSFKAHIKPRNSEEPTKDFEFIESMPLDKRIVILE